MWKPIFLFAFLLQSAFLFSQSDSLRAESLVEKACQALGKNQPAASRQFYNEALQIFQAHDWWVRWMESHVTLARCWAGDMEQPFVAQAYLDEALHSYRLPHLEPEWEAQARIYLNKGHISQYFIADLVGAAQQYEQCYDIYIHRLQEHNDGIASYLYHQLGNLYTRLGDYERAENLLRQGIDYGSRYQQPDIGKYGDLAIVLVDVGKSQAALDVIQAGLQSGLTEKALVTTRLCESRAWLQLGNMGKAKIALSKCPVLITHLSVDKSEQNYYWAGYYAALGTLQDSIGEYPRAEINYRKAIQKEISSWKTPYQREVGKSYGTLGSFYLRQQQPRQALQAFQRELQCVLRNFQPASINEQPDEAQFYAENTIIEGLLGKANAFEALGQLEQALACYELIPGIETRLRATHAYESSSLLALGESRKRFDAAIRIAWQLYAGRKETRYAERAFRLTEQARGMLLLQSLARAQAEYQLPDSIRRRDNDLRVQISWYEQQIAAGRSQDEKANAEKIKQLEKELFDLKRSQEEFVQGLRRDYPDFAHLSDEITFLQIKDVPGLLRPGQALVDYYLTETEAYIFWLDVMGRFTWRRADLPAHFREIVRDFAQYPTVLNENVRASRDQQFRETATALFQQLLAPELAAVTSIQSLLIVPDDALVFVPFELLLQGNPAGDWADLPWLLVQYNIGYAYSATLLAMQQQLSRQHAQANRPRYTLGGFAPSYDPVQWASAADSMAMPRDKVYNVQSTLNELEKVQHLLGGQAYYGRKATEAQFRLTAPDCRVLLLAMHGFADDQHPELSRLLFGNPVRDAINNNVLFANELQIMQLHADLAVLSACHTGFGRLNKGEGVYSLARAFAAAGVPCTVMSLWQLHETTGPVIVEAFFKYLQAGKPKDEALRLAKLDFLRDPNNAESAAPYYWAGIMVTGDLQAMDLPALPPTVSRWPLAGLGILVLGGGWWWMWRRKHPVVQPLN